MSEKIAVICCRDPHNKTKGDTLIIRNRLKTFTKNYEVHVIVVKPFKLFSQLKHLPNTEGEFQLYELNISVFDMLIGLVLLPIYTPLQVRIFYGKIGHVILENFLFERNIKFSFFYTIRTSTFRSKSSLSILEAIDCLSKNFLSISIKKPIGINYIYKIESFLLSLWEKRGLRKFDLVTAVNKNELSSLHNDNRIWTPNGVEIVQGKKPGKNTFTVCLSGNMNYPPNKDAYEKFVSIAASVTAVDPRIHFVAIGFNAEALPKFNMVQLISNPDEILYEISKCNVSLCPVTFGSGMQNKILEGIVCGNHVIASGFSLSAFSDRVQQECICANSNAEVSKVILEIFRSGDWFKNYDKSLVESLSWSNSTNSLLDHCKSIRKNIVT